MKIRCSSLPRIMSCPASAWLEADFGLTGPEAQLGTAVHAAIAQHIMGQGTDLFEDRWGLAPEKMDDFRYLLGTGIKFWAELSKGITDHKVEVKQEHGIGEDTILSGTADVEAIKGDGSPVILDWKSGYPDASDYTAQMRGYCWLSLQFRQDAQKATAALVWLRSREVVVREWGRQELEDWAKSVVARVTLGKSEFCPGDQCRYCPVNSRCQARASMAVAAATDLLAMGDKVTLTPVMLAAGWEKVKMVKAACDRYESALKLAVHMCPEGLPMPDGRILAFEKKSKDELHLNKDTYELCKAQGIDPLVDLVDSLKLSKTVLMERIRAKAPRGLKGKVADEFIEKVRATGAIRTNTYEQMITKGVKTDA